MAGRPRGRWVAGVGVLALALAACGGGGDGDGGGDAGGGGQAQAGGEVAVRGCNPENPLVPANTNETCGGNVLDAVLAKLVKYDTDTAKPENNIAESIEPNADNTQYTIKLKSGWKFHDGTDVTAKSFVDAWNWGAYAPNAALNSYFFEPIAGYADLQSTDPDEDGPKKAPPPKAKEMSGLKVVSDTEFTVGLSSPSSTFPQRLGYTAFAPLPESFFADNGKAFGDKPIGAGPFKVDTYSKGREIVLSRYADYQGEEKPNVDKVTYRIYQDAGAAYTDVVANNLDITDEVPTSALTDDKYKQDLPDRFTEREEGVIQTITFPPAKVDPAYQNPDLRKAISMAINREEIIRIAFNNTRVPATGWVSPVVDGYKEGGCGEFCTFDAAKAKQLLDQAGGFTGTMTLSYNADAAHKEWTEAACNSIKNALGVNCQAKPVVDFATFRAAINARKMKGMFRTGWQMDYPSIENFLVPIYATGAGSNDGDYSNPEFDAKLKEAAAAKGDEVNTLYQEAETMLAEDFPAIPLWYGKQIGGFSDKVENVKFSAFGTYDLTSVSVKG